MCVHTCRCVYVGVSERESINRKERKRKRRVKQRKKLQITEKSSANGLPTERPSIKY